MVENKLLKKIGFLKDLPDAMLEKVGAIAQLETFDKENILFRNSLPVNGFIDRQIDSGDLLVQL